MKEILFGTTNLAKIKQLQGVLRPIGVAVRGIPVGTSLPVIIEDGKTANENAKKKAIAYAKTFGEVVLSMDNALYFDGLDPEKQPGICVRRIGNGDEHPSDEALLEYYTALVQRLGGRIKGRWEFGICIATPEGKTKETLILSSRIFTDRTSSHIIPGYPLESIQIDPESGKYISEMTQKEQDEFWQHTIGAPLREFMKSIG